MRKILGGSITDLVALTSADFIRLAGLAVIMASSVVWYAMHQWLQTFAYKIKTTGWMFILANLVAILLAFITVTGQTFHFASFNPVRWLKDE